MQQQRLQTVNMSTKTYVTYPRGNCLIIEKKSLRTISIDHAREGKRSKMKRQSSYHLIPVFEGIYQNSEIIVESESTYIYKIGEFQLDNLANGPLSEALNRGIRRKAKNLSNPANLFMTFSQQVQETDLWHKPFSHIFISVAPYNFTLVCLLPLS